MEKSRKCRDCDEWCGSEMTIRVYTRTGRPRLFGFIPNAIDAVLLPMESLKNQAEASCKSQT